MNISLNRAVELLRSGEVVAFPTETVYGLGADAKNRSAVQKVFNIKKRPADNPLIVHISNPSMIEDFAKEVPKEAAELIKLLWPGPLTLIFKKDPQVLDIVTSGLDTVALRWPKHPVSQQLIAMAGPLVAPSANSSGKPSPTKADHVLEDFGDDFPVIDVGETEIGLESTVLDISSKPLKIYRPGAVSSAEIENITGIEVLTELGQSNEENARSPGTRYSHYSPEAVVSWMDESEPFDRRDTLYLIHQKTVDRTSENIISYEGNYRQMARELYDRFRQADHNNYRFVKIEPFNSMQSNKTLVKALKNRISKAVG